MKKATSAATNVDEFADIASNAYFKILLNSELIAVEKQKAVAKVLSFAKNKEQAKQSLEEFNTAVMDFENRISPLTNIDPPCLPEADLS
ncbi:hypothetical protein [Maritalea sp.]|uniref:hypothetical protein n=1 Tax=Maritalea sp. TaxID=2003361 RepID=UPI003EF091D6